VNKMAESNKKEVLIEVKNLKKYFEVGRNATLKAIKNRKKSLLEELK